MVANSRLLTVIVLAVTMLAVTSDLAALGITGSAAPNWTVNRPLPPGITYTASGGIEPYGWTSFGLPLGVSLVSGPFPGLTATLTGTPQVAGTVSQYRIRVVDFFGPVPFAELEFNDWVIAPPPQISGCPPDIVQNESFQFQLAVTGGTSPFTWSVTGTLPPGITLDPQTGILSGTPTTLGNYPVTFTVTDVAGATDLQFCSSWLVYNSPLIKFSPSGVAAWTPHGQEIQKALTVKNVGNQMLNVTTVNAVKLSSPGLDWLSVTPTNFAIPAGVANTLPVTVTLNKSGVVNQIGTCNELTGRLEFISNAPTSPDTVTVRCVVIDNCCRAPAGNLDVDCPDVVDIGDLTILIDHLFISFTPLMCEPEGNVDGIGTVDISDLTLLIDHLFINFSPIPAGCP